MKLQLNKAYPVPILHSEIEGKKSNSKNKYLQNTNLPQKINMIRVNNYQKGQVFEKIYLLGGLRYTALSRRDRKSSCVYSLHSVAPSSRVSVHSSHHHLRFTFSRKVVAFHRNLAGKTSNFAGKIERSNRKRKNQSFFGFREREKEKFESLEICRRSRK